MIKIFSRARHFRGSKSIFLKAKTPLNLTQKPNGLKLFSASNVHLQQSPNKDRQLPNLLYLQNPITWMINKLDFFMLRKAWDPEFNENEFKRGVRQAVAVICTLISKNLWTSLRGLVTSKTLTRLQREVEGTWDVNTRKIIAIEPSDVQMVLPRKVHFLRISEQKLVDVDVICVAMKFLDDKSLNRADILLIEILARFHRNYTMGQLPNWTVTLFKVSTQYFESK